MMKLANHLKRMLSALLIAVLVLGMLPVTAMAADVHAHNYTAVVTAPTCTEDGYTTYTCDCGDVYTADTVAAWGHAYRIKVTKPTCTEDGCTTYTCIDCGDSYIGDTAAALGHNYTAVVTAPTCTEVGYTTYTCAACRDKYYKDIVAALGHSYSAVVTAPTCTEDGYTTYTCDCGDTYTAGTVAATGHSYTTAEVDGYLVYTCACGDSYAEKLPDEHEYTAVVTKPTCTEDGYTTYTCQCGDSYTADSVAATGHGYTCAEVDGYLVYTCVGCGDSYSEKLPTEVVYTKVNRLSDNRFVITLVSGNKYYALSHSGNKLSAVGVTVENNQITSEITEDLVWNYSGRVLSYESRNRTYYLYAQSSRLSLSTNRSTTVSLSNDRLRVGNNYLYYSNGAISLNRSGTTAGLFAETVHVIAPV